MHMDVSSQWGIYQPLTKVYPVDAHENIPIDACRGFPTELTPLLDRQIFIRVYAVCVGKMQQIIEKHSIVQTRKMASPNILRGSPCFIKQQTIEMYYALVRAQWLVQSQESPSYCLDVFWSSLSINT